MGVGSGLLRGLSLVYSIKPIGFRGPVLAIRDLRHVVVVLDQRVPPVDFWSGSLNREPVGINSLD